MKSKSFAAFCMLLLFMATSWSQDSFDFVVDSRDSQIKSEYYITGEKEPLRFYQTNFNLGVILNAPFSDADPSQFPQTDYKLPIKSGRGKFVKLKVPIQKVSPIHRLSIVLYADIYESQKVISDKGWQRPVYAISADITRSLLLNSLVYIAPEDISHTTGFNMAVSGFTNIFYEDDKDDASEIPLAKL